jgi:dipeptidyl-peptidase-3
MSKFMTKQNLSAYNTRLFKRVKQAAADAPDVFDIRLASVEKRVSSLYEFEGVHVYLWYGDYSDVMKQVIDHLTQAKLYTANDIQTRMIEKYIATFTNGDIEEHKASQRLWVQDKGPIVETNIGFIESYRDPYGSRGEWEGFVSIVNKDQSKKYGALVDNAELFLAKLPWEAAYEKDKFSRPDFSSLEVVSFGSSGIPAGWYTHTILHTLNTHSTCTHCTHTQHAHTAHRQTQRQRQRQRQRQTHKHK